MLLRQRVCFFKFPAIILIIVINHHCNNCIDICTADTIAGVFLLFYTVCCYAGWYDGKCIYSILKFSIIFTVYSVFFLQPSIFFFFTAMTHLSAINRHKQTTLLAGGTQCVIQWCKGVNLANTSVTNY